MMTDQHHTDTTPRSRGRSAVLVVTAIIGAITLLVSGGGAALAATADLRGGHGPQHTRVDGVRTLDLDVGARSIRVAFADVDEARIDDEGPSSWDLSVHGDRLVVRSAHSFLGGVFDGWFGQRRDAVLTLPDELGGRGLDAELTVGAGRLEIDGGFGDIDARVGAGALRVSGSAVSVRTRVDVGKADLSMSGVRTADFTVAVGEIVADLAGRAPSEVSIDVNVGSVDLTVPDVPYALTQSVSAGSFDNRVRVSSDARNRIDATVAVGSAIVRAEP